MNNSRWAAPPSSESQAKDRRDVHAARTNLPSDNPPQTTTSTLSATTPSFSPNLAPHPPPPAYDTYSAPHDAFFAQTGAAPDDLFDDIVPVDDAVRLHSEAALFDDDFTPAPQPVIEHSTSSGTTAGPIAAAGAATSRARGEGGRRGRARGRGRGAGAPTRGEFAARADAAPRELMPTAPKQQQPSPQPQQQQEPQNQSEQQDSDSHPPSATPSTAAPAPATAPDGADTAAAGQRREGVAAVRGDRRATGGVRKPKLTEAELAEKMARISVKNASLTAAYARAEADAASFAQREEQAERAVAQRRREERRDRQQMMGERERNRARKLKAMGGREWDAEKLEGDFDKGGRFDKKGGFAGDAQDYSDGREYLYKEPRGGGAAGRGRGGSAARGGKTAGQAAPQSEDFPSLPEAPKTAETEKAVDLPQLTDETSAPVGSWADQVESTSAAAD